MKLNPVLISTSQQRFDLSDKPCSPELSNTQSPGSLNVTPQNEINALQMQTVISQTQAKCTCVHFTEEPGHFQQGTIATENASQSSRLPRVTCSGAHRSP